MVQKEYAQLKHTNGLCAAGTKGLESGYQICQVEEPVKILAHSTNQDDGKAEGAHKICPAVASLLRPNANDAPGEASNAEEAVRNWRLMAVNHD